MKTRVAKPEDMQAGVVVRRIERGDLPFADCVVLGKSILGRKGWIITRPYYCWNAKDDNDPRPPHRELEYETFESTSAEAYLVYVNDDDSVFRLTINENIRWF